MSDMNENSLNPMLFELKLVFVRRPNVEVEYGWHVQESMAGVMVERVVDETPINVAHIAAGNFVMSVNGRRIKTMADLDIEIKDQTSFRAIVAIRRKTPLDTNTMLLPGDMERRHDCEYVVYRMDQSSYPRVGLKTGLTADRVTVFAIDNEGAAFACGIKVGDRILGIGAARPRDEQHFRRILRVVQGDPIDVVVERSITAGQPKEPLPLPVQVRVITNDDSQSKNSFETSHELEQLLDLDFNPFTPKTSESKTSESKTSESKTSESKTSESKTSESKTSESKTSESKTSESKTSESKTSESKTSESKTSESTTNESNTTPVVQLRKGKGDGGRKRIITINKPEKKKTNSKSK